MRKTFLIGALAVAGLAGCATGPYDNYGYGYGPTYDPYYYNYGYGAPGYFGPEIGFGYYYFDGDGNRHFRDRGDRGRHFGGRGPGDSSGVSRDSRGGETVGGNVRSSHGE